MNNQREICWQIMTLFVVILIVVFMVAIFGYFFGGGGDDSSSSGGLSIVGFSILDDLIERFGRGLGILGDEEVVDLSSFDEDALCVSSCAATVCRDGSLFVSQRSWTDELMVAVSVKDQLRESFESSKESFLENLSLNEFLTVLGAQNQVNQEISRDPIFAHTWQEINTSTSDYIVNTVWAEYKARSIVLSDETTLEDYLQSPGWRWEGEFYNLKEYANILADELAQMPEGRRVLHLFATIFGKDYSYELKDKGLNGQLRRTDPLRGPEGKIVFRNDDSGLLHYKFPTQEMWVNVTNARLRPLLDELVKLEVQINDVMLDYETYDTSFWATFKQFTNDTIDLFLNDLRTADLLADIGLTEEDIRNMNFDFMNQNMGGEAQMKWDVYMNTQRSKDINRAVFEPFEERFGSVGKSNWKSFLRTDIVTHGDYRHVSAGLSGLGQSVSGTYMTQVLYGVPSIVRTPNGEIFSSPRTPKFGADLTGGKYLTLFNGIIYNMNRANSVSAATSLETRHWVTTPAWIDNSKHTGIFGEDTVYDPETRSYSGGEKIGDAMAEMWYRAAVEANALNLYNSALFPTADGDGFVQRTLAEINELFGYSDREVLRDGKIQVNGEWVTVGPQEINYSADFVVWGARANSKNIYRFIFKDLESSAVVDNRVDGSVVEIRVGDRTILIHDAEVFYPVDPVSAQGVWVVQDVRSGNLIHESVKSFLDMIASTGVVSGEDVFLLSQARVVGDFIEAGYFSRTDYDAFIGRLSFEDVYSKMSHDTLMNVLISRNLIHEDIRSVDALGNELLKKGLDIDELELRQDGLLSAIGDIRGDIILNGLASCDSESVLNYCSETCGGTVYLSLCGNGVIERGEICDDTNALSGDGCSVSCSIEDDYVCVGSPSVCTVPGDDLLLHVQQPEGKAYVNMFVPISFRGFNADTCGYRIDSVDSDDEVYTGCNFRGELDIMRGSFFVPKDYTVTIFARNETTEVNKSFDFSLEYTRWVIVRYSKFFGKGLTTRLENFNDTELEAVDLVLDDGVYGRIEFVGTIDLTKDANLTSNETDIDGHVFISHGSITINSSSSLNRSANITFYNINFISPKILKDGVDCGGCVNISYVGGEFKVFVPGFSNYTVIEGYVDDTGSSSGSGRSSGRSFNVQSYYVSDNVTSSGSSEKGDIDLPVYGVDYTLVYQNDTVFLEEPVDVRRDKGVLLLIFSTIFLSLLAIYIVLIVLWKDLRAKNIKKIIAAKKIRI